MFGQSCTKGMHKICTSNKSVCLKQYAEPSQEFVALTVLEIQMLSEINSFGKEKFIATGSRHFQFGQSYLKNCDGYGDGLALAHCSRPADSFDIHTTRRNSTGPNKLSVIRTLMILDINFMRT